MALNFRSKQWLAGIVLLLCGFIVGVLTSPFVMKNLFHRPDMPPPPPHVVAEHIMERITDELSLTDEQVKQIWPSVEQTANKVEALRQTIEPQIREILDNDAKTVEQFLTPEQKKRHMELINKFKKRQEEMEKRRKKQQ